MISSEKKTSCYGEDCNSLYCIVQKTFYFKLVRNGAISTLEYLKTHIYYSVAKANLYRSLARQKMMAVE